MKNRFVWSVTIVGALLLSACGGGDSSEPGAVTIPPINPTPGTEVPASAAATTSAYVQFALGVVTSETTEPLDTNLIVTAPVSETEEPTTIN